MPTETIIDLVFTALVAGALGALFWTRMNRLEAGQDAIRADINRIWERMATKDDLNRLSDELGSARNAMATKDDFHTLWDELRGTRGEMGGMREEMAVMRSDLTHVALAVGANRPKPAADDTSAN